MKLGAFSVSLAVKDVQSSKQFYEALGFEATGGDADKGWPAHFIVVDPDGNPVLFDQHV